MKSLLILFLLVLTVDSKAQSFSLSELEDFYNQTTYSSREDILLQKGFSLDHKTPSDGYTNMFFVKGNFERFNRTFSEETFQFFFEKSGKAIMYGTAKPEYYQDLKKQIVKECTLAKEEQNSKGDIIQTYTSKGWTVQIRISILQLSQTDKLTLYNISIYKTP